MPTEICLNAFYINLYLDEFFELILFLTPMDYSPLSEREIWLFLKANKRTKSPKPEWSHSQ